MIIIPDEYNQQQKQQKLHHEEPELFQMEKAYRILEKTCCLEELFEYCMINGFKPVDIERVITRYEWQKDTRLDDEIIQCEFHRIGVIWGRTERVKRKRKLALAV